MTHSAQLKKLAAEAALSYVEPDSIIGVGTGSTVAYFIDALSTIKNKIEGAVASSEHTASQLKAAGIRVLDSNSVSELPLYVDSADEVNDYFQLIKGGGGALTREKILATMAKKFICIADESKEVDLLGQFPVAVEVLPFARSFVAREIVKLRASPSYREGFITDNGNIIIDIYNLPLLDPPLMEQTLKNIPGVVENGLFAKRTADLILLGTQRGLIKRTISSM